MLYSSSQTKSQVFRNDILGQIQLLEKDYCQTLSLVVNRELSQHKTRLIRDNLPLAAARLQNVFIESFPTAILAVHKTILTREPNRAVGADQLHVPTLQLMRAKLVGEKLKGTRYSRSTKSLQYRRHIPREAKRTVEAINKLKTKRKKKRNELSLKLLQRCNIKSLRPNYKSCTLRRT